MSTKKHARKHLLCNRQIRRGKRDNLTKKLNRAAAVIKKGGVVVFPTETVYGLGAGVFNPAACRKIFRIKNRPAENPLIVHICDVKTLFEIACAVPSYAKILIDKFWPGPLTLVFKKNKKIPSVVTSGLSTVAVRMPSDKIALELIRLSSTPIAAPSANIFGFVSATDFEHVKSDFLKEKKIDYFLSGGKTKHGLESTIIDATKKKPVILRPGAITVEAIEKALSMKVAVQKNLKKILAPGMYKRHYSPKTPLFIFDDFQRLVEFITKHRNKKIGIIAGAKLLKSAEIYSAPQIKVKTYKNIAELSKNLYGYLRALDLEKLDFITALKVKPRGLGHAINDRLCRAGSVL